MHEEVNTSPSNPVLDCRAEANTSRPGAGYWERQALWISAGDKYSKCALSWLPPNGVVHFGFSK